MTPAEIAGQMDFPHLERVKATLTNDQELSDANPQWLSPASVRDYLNASPRNAVVLHDLLEKGNNVKAHTKYYILRGASERADNFYYGAYPAEDPNDAQGGDFDAAAAISAACLAMIS